MHCAVGGDEEIGSVLALDSHPPAAEVIFFDNCVFVRAAGRPGTFACWLEACHLVFTIEGMTCDSYVGMSPGRCRYKPVLYAK